MKTEMLIIAILVMATVTYLPRVLPLALFKRKIQNPFVRSFLLYMPAVFFSTNSIISAICGAVISLILAWNRRGLLTVAIGGTLAVLVAEWVLMLVK